MMITMTNRDLHVRQQVIDKGECEVAEEESHEENEDSPSPLDVQQSNIEILQVLDFLLLDTPVGYVTETKQEKNTQVSNTA